MHYIAYELGMPRNNSWNNKWTGDDKVHVRICRVSDRSFESSIEKALLGNSFYYDFNDGWAACVSVSEVSEQEAKELTKKSVGFAGYDWMIASLRHDGTITYDKNWQMPIYYGRRKS